MNCLLLASLDVFSRLDLGLFSYYENQNKTISQRVTISCDGPLNILRQVFVSRIDINLCLLRPQPPESQKHRCVVLLLYGALWKAQWSLECFVETGSCSITQAVWELTMELRLFQANKCCNYSHELPYFSSTVLSWKYFLCACLLGLRPCECGGQGTALRELALLFLQCGF